MVDDAGPKSGMFGVGGFTTKLEGSPLGNGYSLVTPADECPSMSITDILKDERRSSDYPTDRQEQSENSSPDPTVERTPGCEHY